MSLNTSPLVSIITPCYNGGHCVHQLFDSINAQTYRPIEFILVNDGSTDNTLQVVEEYRTKFQEAGIEFQCVTQKNRGLAGAINTGLKLFTGEYLCWPDADDYLEPTSIEERVKAFQEHPEVAVVTSDAFVHKCDNLGSIVERVGVHFPHSVERRQFEYMLNGDSIFCSGCHMVKTSCFLDVIPERHIYDCRRGQNWQMLLPLYFKYDRYYLDKPLYNYIVSPNSMSHDDNKLENYVRRYTEHRELLLATLQKIQEVQLVDMHKYVSFVEDKYGKLFMETAIRFRNRSYFLDILGMKQRAVGLDLQDYVANLRSKFPVLNCILSFGRRVLRGGGYTTAPEHLLPKLNRTPDSILNVEHAPLVSIITPCFNGERFLDIYFQSLKKQSYPNLEVIFVNDGSTDNTAKLVSSLSQELVECGIHFVYLEQSNQGAASAVNNALKHVTGQYLMLYDVDDVLYRDAVYGKVIYLLEHPECPMVRNNGFYVKSPLSLGINCFEIGSKFANKNSCFRGLVSGKCNNWPGTYLINYEMFKEANGGVEIYTSHFGQNLQMMMPVAFEKEIGYIRRPLMNYFVRPDSHSHYSSPKRIQEKIHGYTKNRVETLKLMVEHGHDVKDEINKCICDETKKLAQNKTVFNNICDIIKRVCNFVLRKYENIYFAWKMKRYS